MSFFNLGYSLTNINTILEREHFTLEDLLDEQDVVQECSKDNKQVVQYRFMFEFHFCMLLLQHRISFEEEFEGWLSKSLQYCTSFE